MSYDLVLKDQVNARPAQVSLVLPWRDGVPMRLSDLIRERVSLEWDRRGDMAGTRPLVDVAAARRTPAPGGGRAAPAPMTHDDAVALALHGFLHNAFFVIVDDRQVTGLDDELRLTPATEITFVRLLPLVGG